jgi:hypothetical protein
LAVNPNPHDLSQEIVHLDKAMAGECFVSAHRQVSKFFARSAALRGGLRRKERAFSFFSRHLFLGARSAPRKRTGLLPAVPVGTGAGNTERALFLLLKKNVISPLLKALCLTAFTLSS